MVVGGLRLIEWRRETFICGSILWIALEKLKIMKRANMLGFYRKGCFMDWVECWGCLFAGGRESVFCRLHACGVGVFKVCELQRGGEEVAKLGLGFICVYVVGGGKLWLVVE